MAKTIHLEEIGRTGLSQYGGYIFEEILTELSGFKWRKVVREMVDQDAVINAILFVIEMFVRQTSWDIKAASDSNEDQERAAFIKGALFEDMSQSWSSVLSEILTFLPWGWSYPELVYKERKGESRNPGKSSRFNDGRIGWRKWAPRAQESLEHWEFDAEGGLQAMVQNPPPDFGFHTIPIEKALLFRTTVHKGNPEGRSVLRGAYRQWYRKKHIENFEAMGIERDLTGLPVGEVPSDYMHPDAAAEDKAVFEEMKRIVTGVRRDEQGGIVLPSDRDEHGNRLFDFRLLSTGSTRAVDTEKVIQRCDQRIAICVMADFLLLGHTAKSGSYGMNANKGEMFSTAVGAWLDSICEVFNRHAAPRLLGLNAMPTKNAPQLTHGDVEKVDLTELGEYIAKLSGSGIVFGEDEVRFLKQQVKGMPVMEEQQESQPGKREVDGEKKKDPARTDDPADDDGEEEGD